MKAHKVKEEEIDSLSKHLEFPTAPFNHLSNLNVGDIREIKALSNPPQMVKDMADLVVVVTGKKQKVSDCSWSDF